jgi:hypothetical protein
MSTLATFGLTDMLTLSTSLRQIGQGAANLTIVAQRMVRHLYDNLSDEQGQPACVLLRCFKLHPFGALPPELATIAQSQSPETLLPHLKCLVLLGTLGQQPEWCKPQESAGHQVIPLLNTAMVQQAPMIAQLFQQLGVEIGTALDPDPALIVEMAQHSYNIFYVPHALGSPYIPAQEHFVRRHGVQSVLGFGGVLPDGNFYAFVMFCRVLVSRDTAEMFKTIAASSKLAMIPFCRRVFADRPV